MSNFKAGGIVLEDSPVMIAAGVSKTPESALDWMRSAASAVVSGSYTPERRNANDGTLFYPETHEDFLRVGFGLNRFGMPNMGYAAAARLFDEMRPKKPLVVSIAGFKPQDYLDGVRAFAPLGSVSAVVLNFGCPNTKHGRIMSFNVHDLQDTIAALYGPKPVWMKFSPYSDPALLKEVAELINANSSKVQAVVSSNTFPNAYAGKGAMTPLDALAGLSGPAMKAIALGQVMQWRKHLKSEIDVIGVGGITTGNDVIDFMDAGAVAVKVASLAYWLGDPGGLGEALTKEGTSERFIALLEQGA